MKRELWYLLKQRSVVALLLLSMGLTFASLQNGWQNIQHIRGQIEHAQQAEAKRKQDYLQQHAHDGKLDAGEVGYYVFHHVYDAPAEWSFIALGNRIVTPYVQRIRLLGLQGQLYDGESHHPEYVMLGGFDYAFWLVFFAPLFCIALMHDLKASEHQAHRLLFLNSLTTHPLRFWLMRLSARSLLIAATFILPVMIFAAVHALSLNGLLLVGCMSLAYVLCWTVISALVALRASALNASLNAMVLSSIWLLLCVVLPNLAQLWLQHQLPVQEGSQIALQHRQLVHSAWDVPKEDTLTPFYQLYPQWQNTPPVTGRFHWKWYYAFQHLADVKLADQVTAREQALIQRQQAMQRLSLFLPSVWVQSNLEALAQSDVMHLLAHRAQIQHFHTQLRHDLYPFLFEEKPFTSADFAQMPRFEAKPAH